MKSARAAAFDRCQWCHRLCDETSRWVAAVGYFGPTGGGVEQLDRLNDISGATASESSEKQCNRRRSHRIGTACPQADKQWHRHCNSASQAMSCCMVSPERWVAPVGCFEPTGAAVAARGCHAAWVLQNQSRHSKCRIIDDALYAHFVTFVGCTRISGHYPIEVWRGGPMRP